MQLTPELIAKLNKLAAQAPADEAEPADPHDRFGGNMDDAYYGGVDDGQAILAAEILAAIEGQDA